MRSSIALLAALAAFAFAENKTVQFFAPGGGDGVDLVASVVTANPSTTVLDFTCPTDTDASDCGWGPGLLYSIVSTTVLKGTMSEDDFTLSFSCNHNTQKTQMSCSISQAGGNDPGTTSAILTGTDVGFLTATITAGAEKLSATGAVQSGQSSGVQTSVVSPTGTASVGAKPSGSGPSATAPGAAAQKTGAAAYRYGVEGSALLALAGAVAINAW